VGNIRKFSWKRVPIKIMTFTDVPGQEPGGYVFSLKKGEKVKRKLYLENSGVAKILIEILGQRKECPT
jgi:hypothetical protein